MGAPGLGEMKPQQMLKTLSESKKAGVDIRQLLSDKTTQAKLESARASLPSIASGLKAWEAFVADLLGYPRGTTLPPTLPPMFFRRLSENN